MNEDNGIPILCHNCGKDLTDDPENAVYMGELDQAIVYIHQINKDGLTVVGGRRYYCSIECLLEWERGHSDE